jgi:uncharacterized metal-binding protein YceD (DUF177 family)
MKTLKEFNIQFVGLKLGNHVFEYEIDNTFFEAFDFDEFHNSNIHVTLDFAKKNNLLELNFQMKGTVNVDCDVSLEAYDQEIEGDFSMVIKFGPEYNDDNDEILILPHEEYQVNVSQYIYELIILSMPSKRVHPKVLDGTLESEALKKLKELEVSNENPAESKDEIDPRWDKLKGLITEKNT